MLYIVATPIGNLSDITHRALAILQSCDYILCEDKRSSSHLLNHYNIKKSLISYHKFSESSQIDSILNDLTQGKNIALISDAGTPGIADPGTLLVMACRENNIAVTPIPGPCAAITALCASGLNTDKFQFIGFLPKGLKELSQGLAEALQYPGITICYESPHRLLDTLAHLHDRAPECTVAIARELTKIFEEHIKGSPQFLIDHWKDKAVKGEIVLLIQGGCLALNQTWDSSPEDHVQRLIDEGQTMSDAVKTVAKQRNLNKRTLYKSITKSK